MEKKGGGEPTIVVEPEQDGQQDGKGQRGKDFTDAQVPETNQPGPPGGRLKGKSRRQPLQLDAGHASDVYEAREEDEGQRRAVILEKHAHRLLEQAARAQLAAHVRHHEDQQGRHDGQVEGGPVAEAVEHLDALLEVDEGDVEAEDVAGKPGDPAQPVARVCNRQEDMQNEGPSTRVSSCFPFSQQQRGGGNIHAYPGHEANIVYARVFHNVVYSAGGCLLVSLTRQSRHHEDQLVKYGNRTWYDQHTHTLFMAPRHVPVTPTMTSGCAANTANTTDPKTDASSTSFTP